MLSPSSHTVSGELHPVVWVQFLSHKIGIKIPLLTPSLWLQVSVETLLHFHWFLFSGGITVTWCFTLSGCELPVSWAMPFLSPFPPPPPHTSRHGVQCREHCLVHRECLVNIYCITPWKRCWIIWFGRKGKTRIKYTSGSVTNDWFIQSISIECRLYSRHGATIWSVLEIWFPIHWDLNPAHILKKKKSKSVIFLAPGREKQWFNFMASRNISSQVRPKFAYTC